MKILIISDDNGFRGGAGMIANAEYFKINELINNNCVFFVFQHKKLPQYLIPLLFLYKNVLLFFKLFFYITKKSKLIIHTWSYLPVIAIFQLFFPNHFIFVIHDYLLICPSKSFYNNNLNIICNVEGYSSECLNCNCGYN